MDNSKKVKPADSKAEFLMELVDRYNYWKGKNEINYALAYERLLYAHTAQEPPKKDDK